MVTRGPAACFAASGGGEKPAGSVGVVGRTPEDDLRTRGEIKWKHAMHLLGLLRAGCVALEAGELPVRVAAHPYPLLFVTISGVHLYGFASADSDCDLRGVHLLSLSNLLGLDLHDETVSREEVRDGADVDLVTHDARKFFGLLLRKNGYVLEQLLSPLVVHAAPGFEELRELAKGCVTKNHAHHYQGFALNQWELFAKERPRRVKPLLYCYRVLLTGIHLLQTGEVEANLATLNEGEFRLSHVADLLAAKRAGTEGETLTNDADTFAFHAAEFARLLAGLEQAAASSALPELPSVREELNALLLRLRGVARA